MKRKNTGKATKERATGRHSIGVYNEKLLHQILKERYTDTGRQEVKIGPFTADILKGNEITEIQTGSFYPLRNKISYYLNQTEFNINIIKPVAAEKILTWLNKETGEAVSRRRSPKSEKVRQLLREVFWLSEYIGNSRLKITALEVCLEEMRLLDGWSRDKKKGSTLYQKIPLEYFGETILKCAADYAALLPAELPPEFTRSEYSSLTGARSLVLASEINALCSLGVIENTGKRGRSLLYKKLFRHP